MPRLTRLYMAGWIVAFNLQKIFVVRSLINSNKGKGNWSLKLRHSSSSSIISSSSVVAGVSQDSVIQSSVQEEESMMIVLSQPPYQIAGRDLSTSWIDLVKQNQVSVTTQFRDDDSDNDGNDNEKRKTMIDYGIRMVEIASNDDIDKETSSSTTSDVSTTKKWMFQEYVVQQIDDGEGEGNPIVRSINSTLSRINSGVEFKQIGDFVTQLQLLRTLRPPPSKEFIETTSSTPPPYNPITDSFVTGPLRLELRPLIGRLQLSSSGTSGNTINNNNNNFNNNNNNCDDDKKNNNDLLTTPWDVYHNISPADRRGHFLIMPSLLDKEHNWRGQKFTKNDCHDMVHLTSTIEPVGSMFLGYNAVGAGASQNHIHCHAWPYPTFGSVKNDGTESPESTNNNSLSIDNFSYAVTKVETIYDFYDIDGGVEVSYLKYPVFCVLISSSIHNLDLLGRVVASCLETIGEAPYNIGFLNRLHQREEDEKEEEKEEEEEDAEYVDVYIFARSKERSDILPTLKMGISEMMGVFHAQSEDELETLGKIDKEDCECLSIDDDDNGHSHDHSHDHNLEEDGSLKEKSVMEQALADISFEDEEDLWQRITENLATL